MLWQTDLPTGLRKTGSWSIYDLAVGGESGRVPAPTQQYEHRVHSGRRFSLTRIAATLLPRFGESGTRTTCSSTTRRGNGRGNLKQLRSRPKKWLTFLRIG